MKNLLPSILITVLFFASCGTPKAVSPPTLLNDNVFLLTEISTNPSYGLTEKDPVMVGGVEDSSGPLNERRYLNALAGPDGQKISYERVGNCCMFDTKNGIMGRGLLDIYKITWRGQTEEVMIYINMYDTGNLMAPVGFTIISEESLKGKK